MFYIALYIAASWISELLACIICSMCTLVLPFFRSIFPYESFLVLFCRMEAVFLTQAALCALISLHGKVPSPNHALWAIRTLSAGTVVGHMTTSCRHLQWWAFVHLLKYSQHHHYEIALLDYTKLKWKLTKTAYVSNQHIR